MEFDDSESFKDGATIDHIIPISQGGTNNLQNLLICCRSCNSSKGKKNIEQYRKYFLKKHMMEQIDIALDDLEENGNLHGQIKISIEAGPIVFHFERLSQ